ncbi:MULTISPECIES: hypothetical protein [Haloferax]|uniref:Small CPxCG-related zinc finger protein n=2 Tax=Haloferax gibbonsii TaxID=35746 RepID=A0A0K1IQE2_HALGI|nr:MULTISPECIES: hypothetical protein [Haloferax]AKU06752.1 hypothetical protein ABY42_02970 [Haloferax gibbonsii]ELZ83543.1 hypothetical protein C454_04497 [Haloferax gibbonsii ATCC 33959]QOS10778.1 small CPxCG-related zinc finger protein [Haloferax gibbonsii]RDZ54609.1 hypothetical protein C5C07_03545 [Haloferax sp. Atlit-4N]REA05759.1 hypothetical protein DEQ92_05650 [Haloferax sp. Atlit-6N]
MGDRNHLHVCQHCGVVHATASPTAPEACVVCEALTFSPSELNALLRTRGRIDPESTETDGERARWTSPLVSTS